jgi:hypothetical protein
MVPRLLIERNTHCLKNNHVIYLGPNHLNLALGTNLISMILGQSTCSLLQNMNLRNKKLCKSIYMIINYVRENVRLLN